MHMTIEVRELTTICQEHIELSEEIIKLAKDLEKICGITGADALHISFSANTRYFMTCDDFILSRRDCINKFMREKGFKVKVINIIKFKEERKWEW
ncbi:MAG: hypothetical protein PQ964_05765 [Methanobacteriaceae archaeon]|jgi:hypothetical protein